MLELVIFCRLPAIGLACRHMEKQEGAYMSEQKLPEQNPPPNNFQRFTHKAVKTLGYV